MRIAFIIPGLPGKGPVYLMRNLIKGLMNRNIETEVFYFDEDCVVDIPCNTRRISYGEKIDFDSFDIIHSHGLRADFYVYRWRKHIKRAKTVSTIHQDTLVNFKYKYPAVAAVVLTRFWCYIQNSFDAVVAISHQIEDTYSKYFSTYLTTIYNGVDVETEDNPVVNNNILADIRKCKDKGYKMLGLYALIGERKGIDQILNVLPQMTDYALTVIGDGPYKNTLKELAVKNNIADRVLFIPALKYPFLYLTDIDVYCMTSYSEAFGLAMVEAAMMEKPIVCSELPSFHEIFLTDEACFFELHNPESLIRAIETACTHREEYGRKARMKSENNFTYQIMADNYRRLYQSLLSNNQ